jgi:flagellar protein FlaJ
MELKKIHWLGMILALAVIGSSFFFWGTRFFFFTFGMGVLIGATPFVFTILRETRIANEKEEMFLEFARNLVESVKTGTPISKSIVNVKNKPFGVLSENVKKLANQISLGIPLNIALATFAKDVKNKTISRTLTLIGQAERGGGEIGGILEAVTEAVTTADKLKKERKAAISTLVVQGYIIFFVFIVIILVMQFQILPMIVNIVPTGETLGITGIGGGAPLSEEEISNSFLYLLLIQGLFSGLTIGKLAEGSAKTGIKHSFVLMLVAFLISTGSNLLFGGGA